MHSQVCVPIRPCQAASGMLRQRLRSKSKVTGPGVWHLGGRCQRDLAHCLLPTLGSFAKLPLSLRVHFLRSLQAFQSFQRWAHKSVPTPSGSFLSLFPANSHRLHLSRGRCFPLHSQDLAIKTHLPSCKGISHPGGGEGSQRAGTRNSPRLHGIFGRDGPGNS